MNSQSVTVRDKAEQFGRDVAAARVRMGWSQTDLGKRAKIRRERISYIETGAWNPTEAELARLREHLPELAVLAQPTESPA